MNIGTVTAGGKTYSGGNLTVMGDTLVKLTRGDLSCSVNIDGITYIRTTSSNEAVFQSLRYTGKLNVTNANIILAAGGALIDSNLSQVFVDQNDNKELDSGDIRTLCEATFDNCLILTDVNSCTEEEFISGTNKNQKNLIADNYGFKSIIFRNTVTNGRVNPSRYGGVVFAEEGTVSAYISADRRYGFVVANYNHPISLAPLTDGTTYTAYTVTYDATNKNFVTTDFVIAAYGSSEDADLTMPLAPKKVISREDALILSFVGFEGTVLDEYYVYGANVLTEAPELEPFEGEVITATHTGWASEVPSVITETTIIEPIYETSINAAGLKVNLSLYSEFVINLYIPIEYHDYIAAVECENGENYEYLVDLDSDGEVDHTKYVAKRSCDKLTDKASFEIIFCEGELEATRTVSISIADYASAIADGEGYSDSDKQLIYYMLTYANAASAYFGGAADSTVSSIIEKCEKYKGEALTHTFDKALNDTGLGKAFTEATLKLDYAPAFIFTLEDGFEGTVTVTYGPNVHVFEVGADDERIIEIEGMKVYNFAENLTVTAEGKIGEDHISISGSYNLDTYISYHIANASDENSETKASSEALLALLYALYDYVVIADNYN